MRTRQQITVHGDDNVVIKARIPRTIYALINQLAKDLGFETIQAWTLFMARIAGEIEEGNTGFLGTEFVRAARALSMRNELGTVDGMPPIDFAKLQRSEKAKSGFVGVFSNGHGYRAEGRNPVGVGMVGIGTYPTAEQAAWARCLHYQKHGLPYGVVEDRLKEFWLLVKEFRACYPTSEQAQTDDDFLVSMLQPHEVDRLTAIAFEVGIKFGPIDGTKKITTSLFEPYRGDGTDEPSEVGSPIPITDGRRQWAKRELTAEDQAKIDAATGAIK